MMVKKVAKSSSFSEQAQPKASSGSSSFASSRFAEQIKASAQQIYAAGLAQFAKTQQEGGKVFEGLVNEGLAIQRKTQAAAEERINEVSNKASGIASEITSKAQGQWNKLEEIFEDRVSRSLKKLGIPTAAEFAELKEQLATLKKKPATKKATATNAAKPKAAAKKTGNTFKTTVKPAAKKLARKTN